MVEDMSSAFSPLGQLWKLNLAHNIIKSINLNVFTGLNRVTELDLTGNNITTIQENAFLPMSGLTQLKMNSRKFEFNVICIFNILYFCYHSFIIFYLFVYRSTGLRLWTSMVQHVVTRTSLQ